MMMYRIVSALIILFWLCMMGLLVQRTWFANRAALVEVPYETVLQAVLKCEEQPQLTIRDSKRHGTDGLGEEIGQWHMEVKRVRPVRAGPSAEPIDPATRAHGTFVAWRPVLPTDRDEWAGAYYHLDNELAFRVQWEDAPELQIRTDCYFDPNFNLVSFSCKLRLQRRVEGRLIADDALQMHGEKATGKIQVLSMLPELQNLPPMPFSFVEKGNLAQYLGLGSLPNVARLVGLSPLSGKERQEILPSGKMICREGTFQSGNQRLETYVVENRSGQDFWIKLYVSKRGEIWKVETPFGIEMEGQLLR